eukprot:gene11068-18675_t
MIELGNLCQQALAGSLESEAEESGYKAKLPRVKWIRQLPELDMTGGILVIVEPGTPGGFANVRDAREQILGQESRRRDRELNRSSLNMDSSGNSTASSTAGAHVLAPCGHDGTCPMQGKRMWCHFGQRIQRPSLMKVDGNKRSYQDEEYSYVVLRRGPRPADDPAWWEAADLVWDEKGVPELISHSSAKGGGIAQAGMASSKEWKLPEKVIRRQIMLNRMHLHTKSRSPSSSVAVPMESPSTLEGTKREVKIRSLFKNTPGAELDGKPSQMQPLQDLSGDSTDAPHATLSSPRQGGEICGSFALKYPAYGAGLVDRLITMENKGIGWEGGPSPSGNSSAPGARQGLAMESAELAHEHQTTSDEAHDNKLSTVSGASSLPLTAAAAAAGTGTDSGDLSYANYLDRDPTDNEDEEDEEEDSPDLTDDFFPESDTLSFETQPPTDDERALAVKQLQKQIFGIQQMSEALEAAPHEVDLGAAGNDKDGDDDTEDEIEEPDMALSQRWGRVYRPPRHRGGHVILDLCVPDLSAGPVTQESGTSRSGRRVEKGRLERHTITRFDAKGPLGPAAWKLARRTITRSDAKGPLGPAAWKMARRVEWGALWPRHYIDRHRRMELVLDPDLKVRLVAKQRAARDAQEEEEGEDEHN